MFLAIISRLTTVPAMRTDRCFFRRRRLITRAYRSPKTPLSVEQAVKPAKLNSARIDLGSFIAQVYPITDAEISTTFVE